MGFKRQETRYRTPAVRGVKRAGVAMSWHGVGLTTRLGALQRFPPHPVPASIRSVEHEHGRVAGPATLSPVLAVLLRVAIPQDGGGLRINRRSSSA